MKMSVCRTFTFAAAHYLPNYNGKCRNLHGHTWILTVEVSRERGGIGPEGFVVDFAKLKDEVDKLVVDKLDHTLLNDLMSEPTCEYILQWIWETLRSNSELFWQEGLSLRRVRLQETPGSFAELKEGFY